MDDAPAPPLARALLRSRGAILAAFAFSGAINLLALSGAIYMLQVYDRVLASRSVETLAALSAAAAFAFLALGALDAIRGRLLCRVGEAIEAEAAPAAFARIAAPGAEPAAGLDSLQPLRDVETLRAFAGGPGPAALLDLPFLPIYLAIAALLHPALGLVGLLGAGLLLSMTLLAELRLRRPSEASARAAALRAGAAEAVARSRDAVAALGMGEALAGRFAVLDAAVGAAQRRAGDASADAGALARTLRHMLQAAILGVGALLVVAGELSAGAMIAASIVIARALAPVDAAVGAWRGFVAARGALARLREAFAAAPAPRARVALPAPRRALAVRGLRVGAPGAPRAAVSGVALTLEAGSALAVVGPSGAGKSTLARALVGLVAPAAGEVTLDGAALPLYGPDLGRHVGYLPQDVQLLDGTIAEAIARFAPDARGAEIVEAARAAGAHETIAALPEGYETRVGPGGAFLSAGERQLVGLARALFRAPFLLVLDEPNANLDAAGERAVVRAVAAHRARGGVAVVVAHRPSALRAVDRVLVLEAGAPRALGPRDAVLAELGHARPAPASVPVPVSVSAAA